MRTTDMLLPYTGFAPLAYVIVGIIAVGGGSLLRFIGSRRGRK